MSTVGASVSGSYHRPCSSAGKEQTIGRGALQTPPVRGHVTVATRLDRPGLGHVEHASCSSVHKEVAGRGESRTARNPTTPGRPPALSIVGATRSLKR